MLRVTTAFAAALVLVLPFGCPFLVGLTPAIGLGAGLLTTQRANAQTAEDWFDDGNQKFVSGDYAGAFSDYTKAIELKTNYAIAYKNRGVIRCLLKDYKRGLFLITIMLFKLNQIMLMLSTIEAFRIVD